MNKETKENIAKYIRSSAYYAAHYLIRGAIEAPSSLATGAVFFILLKNSNPVTRILGTFATAGLMDKATQSICQAYVDKV